MKSLLGLGAACFSLTAGAAPFATSDQNPLLAGFLGSQPVSARLQPPNGSTLGATLNWANVELIQRGAGELLIVDAETKEWRLSFERSLDNRFALRFDLPYRTVSGGSLDSVIERWHSTFNFRNGNRAKFPRDDLRIQYQRSGMLRLSQSESASGIGDSSFALGYQLRATDQTAVSAWWEVKLPTGDSDRLLGSGAWDSALRLSAEHVMSRRWRAFDQINIAWLGKGDVLSEQQRSALASATLGVEYLYSQALALGIQIDGHTAAFDDSSVGLLGQAAILTFGGTYERNGWRFQLGIGEDIKVDAAPDVTFILAVRKTLSD